MTVKKDKDGRWKVTVYVGEGTERRRLRRRPGKNTRRAAEELEKDLLSNDWSISTISGSRGIRFRDWAKTFLAKYAKNNNRPTEVLTKESLLRCHLVPFLGELRLHQITWVQIEDYKEHALELGLARKTVNNHLAVLATALKVAILSNKLRSKPTIQFLKLQAPPYVTIEPEECERLISSAEDAWRPMIMTALDTGMRLGELLALSWKDLKYSKGKPYVRVERSDSMGFFGGTKSYMVRNVPITSRLESELKSWHHDRAPWVFAADDGNRWDRHRPLYYLHKQCRLAGIQEVGWHNLRHTFATIHANDLSTPLAVVQKMLGHKHITTTMRYVHVKDKALVEAAESYDQIWQQTGNPENSGCKNAGSLGI